MAQYNSYSEKTNLSDNDVFLILDTDGNATKKVSLTSLKNYLNLISQRITTVINNSSTDSQIPTAAAVKRAIPDVSGFISGTKVTSIGNDSSNTQFPTALAVKNAIPNVSGFISGNLVQSVGSPGSESNVPSEKAVRAAIPTGKMNLISYSSNESSIEVGQLYRLAGNIGSKNPILKYRNDGSAAKNNRLILPILVDDENSDSYTINDSYKVYSVKYLDDYLNWLPLPQSSSPNLSNMPDGFIFQYTRDGSIQMKLSGVVDGETSNYTVRIDNDNSNLMDLTPTLPASDAGFSDLKIGQLFYSERLSSYGIKTYSSGANFLISGSKATSISQSPTNTQFPTAKAVYDFVMSVINNQ